MRHLRHCCSPFFSWFHPDVLRTIKHHENCSKCVFNDPMGAWGTIACSSLHQQAPPQSEIDGSRPGNISKIAAGWQSGCPGFRLPGEKTPLKQKIQVESKLQGWAQELQALCGTCGTAGHVCLTRLSKSEPSWNNFSLWISAQIRERPGLLLLLTTTGHESVS